MSCRGPAVAALLSWISSTQWMLDPSLGPVVFAILSVGIAVGVVAVMAGWRNTNARNTALVTAAIGIVAYFPLQTVFDWDMSMWTIFGLCCRRHPRRGRSSATRWAGSTRANRPASVPLTAFLMSVVMFVDRTMQSWAEYSASSVIRNRPIKTIGDSEDRLEGSFWVIANDTFSHLVLPTLALMLISLAGYTRYSRASMLEVLNQDYIRTARAKGLTNRTVVVRHAFRNALIPLVTIVAFDISAIIGGAVVTESVFEWEGMGRLFIDGLREIDPNRVMAFFVVTGVFAVVFNLLADIIYAVLDPRIRLGGTDADLSVPRPRGRCRTTTLAGAARSTRGGSSRITTPPAPVEADPIERPTSTSRPSSRRRSPASARARSSAAASSATRGRWSSLAFLLLIVVLAATSIGWGPIPGWWKYSYTDLVPSVPDGADGPTLSLRPTWLGGAGIQLGEHPFGLDNERGQGHVRDDDARRADQPRRHHRARHRVDHDRRRRSGRCRATTAS